MIFDSDKGFLKPDSGIYSLKFATPEERKEHGCMLRSPVRAAEQEGIDVERVNEIKFHYELAKESLQVYKSEDVPKIESTNIPKKYPISDLRVI